MAPRATWKGSLKISLVNIPIKVFPGTESSGTLSFNQLHGECQTRIQQKKWCPHCNRDVAMSEIVKGYEFEKGRYVILSAEEIDSVKPASTRVIDLVQFADESALDPMYVDRSYYLAPDGKNPSDAFAVMREGMHGKIGIGKLALHGREYLVAIKPMGRGLVMYTLHHAAEILTIDQIEELNAVPTTVRPEEIKLAKQVIATFDGPLDLATYRDEYVEGLKQVIEAKIRGDEIVATGPEAAPYIGNLMEALTRSLNAVSAQKKKPAKATAGRAAAKRQRKAG